MSKGKLFDKVAIITGSSSGIGAGIAVQFAKEGANLSLTGRNKNDLVKVASECEKCGVKTICTIGDLTEDEFRATLVKNTLQKFNKIDILINNAGVFKATELESWNLLDFDMLFNVNLRSVFHLTALCVPHLIKTKGNIVNISSVCGMQSFGGATVYSMTKAALDMFTKNAAAELAKHNVRVNTVSPGLVYTNVFRMDLPDYDPNKGHTQELDSWLKQNAFGRAGTVDEIAKPVVMLASDDSSYMTGSIVVVDGGVMVNRSSFGN